MPEKIVFVDIDTQCDFMRPRGALYVPHAAGIVGKIGQLTRLARQARLPILSSCDRHAGDDPEFKDFPAHCVRGSRGAEKIRESIGLRTRQVIVPKKTFDVFSNPRMARLVRGFDTAYVYGVALDYCVKEACLGLVARGIRTYLVLDATAAVTPRGAVAAKSLLKRRGVTFLRTAQVIRSIRTWMNA